jgi:hypothetical protein
MQISWEPQWTTQVRIESGGRYALGLNRFHDGLEEILIKGIVGAANRLRYVTYCCWCIGDIQNSEPCKDYQEFVDAFTRRENALALGLYLMNPPYSVYGSSAMSKLVTADIKLYDTTFKLMASTDLGAYDLYYAGTMFNWGLTESNENGVIELTEMGKELYQIVDAQYRATKPKYYAKFKGRKRVPTEILLEWAQVNDFDNIRTPAHKAEREFYKRILFRLDTAQPSDYRRDTFAFVMECIERCSGDGTCFDEDILRNIHYYSAYRNAHNRQRRFRVPDCFKDVHFYWAVYEGHVYFRWWLSRYFEVFLNYLKSCDSGATFEEFFESIDADEFDDAVAAFSGGRGDYYHKPLKTLLGLFRSPSTLVDRCSEEALKEDEDFESSSGVLAKFVLSMANLYLKYKEMRTDRRYQYLLVNLGEDLWFEALFRFTNLEKLSVHEFLGKVLKKYVIDQHDLIMIEKNDLRRCWFTTENGRYFYQADESLIWRPAKYQTIMNFLSDMRLVDIGDDNVRLTREGRTFFQTLQQDYYSDERH